jgi:hypothetical protein
MYLPVFVCLGSAGEELGDGGIKIRQGLNEPDEHYAVRCKQLAVYATLRHPVRPASNSPVYTNGILPGA